MTEPYRLEGLELAAGWVPGHVAHTSDSVGWPQPSPRSVRAALRAAIRPALLARPCFVAFSGGRDSSVVLAVAVDVARREGLQAPVPITRHYPGMASLDEEHWQRRVIDHLGLDEWVRLPFTDELDVVGPFAQRVLARHGVVWPAAAHTSVPLFEAATGGWLLTGEGGDELFLRSRARELAAVLRGRGRRGDAIGRMRSSVALVAPRQVRRRRAVARVRGYAPGWLQPAARAQFVELVAADEVSVPFTLRGRLQHLATRRAWRNGVRTLTRLAEDAGCRVVHPLMDRRVLAALHRTSRPWGHRDRTTALRILFADLLPSDVLGRQSKVVFNDALFSRHARVLVDRWTREGVDQRLVDLDRLRAEWLRRRPSVLSAPLLQRVWCAVAGAQL